MESNPASSKAYKRFVFGSARPATISPCSLALIVVTIWGISGCEIGRVCLVGAGTTGVGGIAVSVVERGKVKATADGLEVVVTISSSGEQAADRQHRKMMVRMIKLLDFFMVLFD